MFKDLLKNKNILITGASGGIGSSAACFFARCGANIALTARNEEKLKELDAYIKKNGGGSYFLPWDLSAIDSLAGMFKELLVLTGGKPIDGFLHCAGVALLRPIKNTTPKVLNNLFNINFCSFVEISRLFAEQKFGSEGASIIGISSIASVTGEQGRLAYSATKGAMDSAVRVMSKELAARNIRVNSIRPGLIDTPLTTEYFEFAGKEYIDDYIKKFQPLGVIPPEHVASLAAYLMSDYGKYITGSSFNIDGGRLA